ncbi:MAG TPA: MgtC/SapB family protein [Candidatus Binatia bacterium]|nr:MgtC/SapB family protein [Candidatus Binatia bacterium]
MPGMVNWPAPLAILAEVFLAMLPGGVIGIERITANKPAGFRTHMLVAGAAALLVGLSDALIQRFNPGAYIDLIESDPIRVIRRS